jgi:hypothetical protein
MEMRAMECEPQGILAIWHDVEPQFATDVLAWYDAEHHFERLGVPGFLSVRRYHAVEARPELFIRYETQNVGVLSSDDYLSRLNNPTPWTLRSQPQFRNNSRTVCVRKTRIGRAEGGFAVTIRLQAGRAEHSSVNWWDALADSLLSHPGIVGAEHWEADRERSTIATREKQLRGGEDAYVGHVIVVHATNRVAAEQALAATLAALPTSLSDSAQAGIYALAFSAQNTAM